MNSDPYLDPISVAKEQLPLLTYNMAALEGNPIGYEEVQTLLTGMTIGGRLISHCEQVLRIADAWKQLIQSVENDDFEFNKTFTCKLHATVAKDEALTWGQFRHGDVRISGTTHLPAEADELNSMFENLITETKLMYNTLDRAIYVFLECAYNQFFFDCNKRTSQFLMNGILLANDEHVITIPEDDAKPYFKKLIHFYEHHDDSEIRPFIKSFQFHSGSSGITNIKMPSLQRKESPLEAGIFF